VPTPRETNHANYRPGAFIAKLLEPSSLSSSLSARPKEPPIVGAENSSYPLSCQMRHTRCAATDKRSPQCRIGPQAHDSVRNCPGVLRIEEQRRIYELFYQAGLRAKAGDFSQPAIATTVSNGSDNRIDDDSEPDPQ